MQQYDAFVSPIIAEYESITPGNVQPIINKAAYVLLSPWLYVMMGLVFLAEKAMPVDRRQRFFSVGLIQDLFAWFLLNGLLRSVVVVAFVGALTTLFERHLSFLIFQPSQNWPVMVRLAVGLLIGDFLNWLHHWIRHKIAVLWLFHTIHHSQKQLNMFTDLRVHVVEYFIAKPIVLIPLLFLGLDFIEISWVALVVMWYPGFYHANVRTNLGPLKYMLVTPQSHRIHHSADPRHQDKNFGLIFSIWDHLFGTQWTNYDEYPQTGVDDPEFPHEQSVTGLTIMTNYLKQFLYPFRAIGRRWRNRSV